MIIINYLELFIRLNYIYIDYLYDYYKLFRVFLLDNIILCIYIDYFYDILIVNSCFVYRCRID